MRIPDPELLQMVAVAMVGGRSYTEIDDGVPTSQAGFELLPATHGTGAVTSKVPIQIESPERIRGEVFWS